MFYEITKIQLKLYEEELMYLTGKTDSIIEFCSTPLLSKGFSLSDEEKKNLNDIITTLKNISQKLNGIKQDIQSLDNINL